MATAKAPSRAPKLFWSFPEQQLETNATLPTRKKNRGAFSESARKNPVLLITALGSDGQGPKFAGRDALHAGAPLIIFTCIFKFVAAAVPGP